MGYDEFVDSQLTVSSYWNLHHPSRGFVETAKSSFRSYPQPLPVVFAQADDIVAWQQFGREQIRAIYPQHTVGISHESPECGYPYRALMVLIH